MNTENQRLAEDRDRIRNWKRWGPYLSDRQWGTVREDYSASQNPWTSFPHDHARSRAYRWGEDGLLGITDRKCRMSFSLALWNGRDPILKERLFGLTGPEGNHGEDAKEIWFHLDSTPTHSYFSSLYLYPQAEFPYDRLVRENAARGKGDREFELADTGVFDEDRYFEVEAEYAKATPEDILIRITVRNRGPDEHEIQVLPTLWFRNLWSWGRTGELLGLKPELSRGGDAEIRALHPALGAYRLASGPGPTGDLPSLLVTENETNHERLSGTRSPTPFVKDAFDRFVVRGEKEAVNPAERGTKAAFRHRITVPAGGEVEIRLRLFPEDARPQGDLLGAAFDEVFAARMAEAEDYWATVLPATGPAEERRVARHALAGLLETKQFYHYAVKEWREGDPGQPAPPPGRGRNRDWGHLYNLDVVSMPDKWEYPWYAAWDLAFHTVAFGPVDPDFAKDQLVLFTREWYMHPNGALPAYEFAFSDTNPPVHAWAAWTIYKMGAKKGEPDRTFLARVFQKLLLNFTWWVNRKDHHGNHLFSGGFLGLDNIGVFDRSKPLPTGGHLEQADGTAWMAFYSGTMLSMALELARGDPAYGDMASKFFEHFVAIVDAMNELDGTGLWDEEDGFYYDRLHSDSGVIPLKIRSLVGLIPLIAAEMIETESIRSLPGFSQRLSWFLSHRPDLGKHISYLEACCGRPGRDRLLAVPSRDRLVRVLRYLLDEDEFLSPFGIRSLSRVHEENPFIFAVGDAEYRVKYTPGESDSGIFGGNSNWRGPVWIPINYLLVQALRRYDRFYGDTLMVECPTGSGNMVRLRDAAKEIAGRLVRLFLPDEAGNRPFWGRKDGLFSRPGLKDRLLFHEYFHPETGRGLGASHQTGWTALVANLILEMQDEQ